METAFPRGGNKVVKTRKRIKKDDDLFKIKSSDERVKSKKRKRNKKSKSDNANLIDADDIIVAVQPLTFQTLTNDMIVLGCIENIRDYELKVLLPGGLVGAVSIANINTSYTNLLKKYTENPDSVEDTIITLLAMFEVGQLVLCKVLSIKHESESSKKEILLSLNPSDVNGNLTANCIFNKMALQAAVSSVEDHGYMMDVGVHNVKCFLKHTTAAAFIQNKNRGQPLTVGHLLSCVINMPKVLTGESIEDRILSLSIRNSIVDHVKVPENANITLNLLQPGMKIPATIQDIKEDGLVVSCLDYTGCVHKDHLKNIWDKPSSYQIGQQIEGVVLYIHPVFHHVYLSLNLSISPQKVKKMFGELKIGEVVDGKVCDIDKILGVYFQLNNKVKALCTKKNLSDEEVENIHEAFHLGSVHKCRIIGVNYIDHLVKISIKQSVIEDTYIPYEDLCVGAIFKGTVKKLVENGMVIKLAHSTHGFVQDHDISDVPQRKYKKLFQPGTEVKCRVLRVDFSKDPPFLMLTTKKTIVNSKLPIITKYEDACPGIITHGTVVLVKENGLLVVFYNGVKGWVPPKELSTQKIEYPEKLFYIGQVVKCCVKSCVPEQNNLKLSLKIENTTPYGIKDMSQDNLLEIGKTSKVKVINTSEKGLDVVLIPDNIAAFLPAEHLSDHADTCNYLVLTYKIGDVIKEVVCYCTQGVILVSKKDSFIEAAKSNKLIKSYSDLNVGMTVVGSIKNFTGFGFFLEMTNNLLGLVPQRCMMNEAVSEPDKCGFTVHQSLMAKVVSLNEIEKKMVLSTRLQDCYYGEAEPSINLLESYLKDWERIKNYYKGYKGKEGIKKQLAELKVGQSVKVEVTRVTDLGLLCKVNGDIPGLATNENLREQIFKVGDVSDGVILFVDLINDCVELTLDLHTIKICKKFKSNESSKPKIGQTIKSQVVLIKNDFILMSLKGHAVGTMAYVPARRHLNDVGGRSTLFTVGEFYHVVIKKIFKDKIIGVLKEHDKDLMDIYESLTSGKSKYQKENLKTNNKLKSKDTKNPKKPKKVKSVNTDSKKINTNEQPNHKQEENIELVSRPKRLKRAIVSDCKDFEKIKCKRKKLQLDLQGSNKIKTGNKNTETDVQINDNENERMQRIVQEQFGDDRLKVDETYKAIIKSVKMFQLNILVNGAIPGRIHITEIAEDIPEGVNPMRSFQINQELKVVFLGYRFSKSKRFLPLTHTSGTLRAECSLRKTRLDQTLKIGQQITVFVKELFPSYVKVWIGPEDTGRIYFLNLSNNTKVLKNPESAFYPCQALKTTIYNINEDYIELTKIGKKVAEGKPVMGQVLSARAAIGIFLHLPFGYCGTVGLTDLKDNFKSADSVLNWFVTQRFVKCQVLSVNHEKKQCILSTRPSRLKGIAQENVHDKEINSISDISKGDRLRGFIASFKQNSVLITIGRHIQGFIHRSNVTYSKENFPIGSVVEVKVLSIKKGKILLQLLNSMLKKKVSKIATDQRRDVITTDQKYNDIMVDQEHVEVASDKEHSAEEDENITFQLPRLQLPEGFSWDAESTSLINSGSESENDADDDIIQPESEKEFSITKRRYEIDDGKEPESVDDYEYGISKYPEDSFMWVKYMQFHLKQAEIEKARAIAERALEAIHISKENERMNIWLAFLNLEIYHGTADSLKETFQKGLQYNEPINMYNELIRLFIYAEKYNEAEEQYKIMVRKFKDVKEVHINFGLFYMKQNKRDEARNVMQKSLTVLENRDHIDVISKFAQMEFKYGDSERGKTMFEGILTNFPKRTDLWSVYIDLMKKQSNLDAVRHIFERVITLKISAKKMKFFFKQYLEFEKQYGTAATVENVKEKALNYVESRQL